MTEVEKDSFGYVTATLPSNCEDNLPVIGFIALFDTAPDMPGIKEPKIWQIMTGKTLFWMLIQIQL
jgi:tripeptide aminopeptidase